jgi:hypothetical protein
MAWPALPPLFVAAAAANALCKDEDIQHHFQTLALVFVGRTHVSPPESGVSGECQRRFER